MVELWPWKCIKFDWHLRFIYLLIDWHSKFVCSMHQMVNEWTVGVPSEAEVTIPPTIRAPYRQNKELCWQQPQPQSYHSGCILFTAHNTSLCWHRIFVKWLKMLSENLRGHTETLPQREQDYQLLWNSWLINVHHLLFQWSSLTGLSYLKSANSKTINPSVVSLSLVAQRNSVL